MTESTAKPKDGLLARLAAEVGISPNDYYDTLCRTIMPGNKTARKEEVIALCHVADQYKLNPWLRQIYAYPAKGGGITPVMGYDGWVALATRHPSLDGVEFHYAEDGSWVECVIHRKDHKVPTTVREYLSECRRETEPWRNMPHRMLRNRAYCQAVRMAFGISGIMLDDEAEHMGEREAKATVVHPLEKHVKSLPQPAEPAWEPEPISFRQPEELWPDADAQEEAEEA